MITMIRRLFNKDINRILAVAVWLVIWQAASVLTGLDIILASPVSVLSGLVSLLGKSSTYRILTGSMLKITLGFVSAVILAGVCAVVAHRCKAFKKMLAPPVLLMKSLPMASFIILLIIWFGSGRVSIFTSFIVTFPIVYSAVLSGIDRRDMQLIEMADVNGVGIIRRICWIDVPQILPIARPDFKVAAGMCLKAGVSAEVIGLARNSIGEQLYYSKLYIDTVDLFAWSIMVVLLSILLEKIFTALIDLLEKWLKKI